MADTDAPVQPGFATDTVDPERFKPAESRTRARGLAVIAVILVVAIAVPLIAIGIKRTEMLGELEQRLEILARGRAEVAATWLDGMTRPADRVVDSELFRLFATEMDLSGGDISDMATGGGGGQDDDAPSGLGVPLAAQLPFMEQVLSDFIKSADFTAGYLVNRKGVAYVTSAGAPTISADQQRIAKKTFKSGVLQYGPVRSSPTGLVLDIYAPVFRAQSKTGRDSPVGVLLLTAPVGAKLAEILAPPPLAEPGERLALVQMVDGRVVEVAPGQPTPLRPLDGVEFRAADQVVPFAERQAVDGRGPVYSVGAPLAGPSWWIVQEIDVAAAEARLGGFVTATVVVTVLAVLAVVAAFGAFWWRLSNEHNAALATQFRRLASRIEAQKRLLDSINDSIAEYIGLKSLDGTYRYVNPAFARAIGRDVAEAVGLDDAAIFGKGTAERLKVSDQRALASGAPVTVNEEVHLGARLHHLQVSKVPYEDETGKVAGVVSVTRDVTDLVEEQKKKERAVHQMVTALVRAVELRDPYLAGHSRRVAGFAVAVAERLGLPAADTATLEIAANLSQIGKLAVPREILNKPGRLDDTEIAEMQTHLDRAAEMLRDIDFELPVLETVYQMHERMDGEGYPKGLKGDSIRMTARVLGACDVFCARVEPRSYRTGIAPEKALEILEENSDRYDPAVVAALREVAGSVTGEKLIAGLAVD